MKSFCLIVLTLLYSHAFAHTGKPAYRWDEVRGQIIAQVRSFDPYSTEGWAPILRRVAARPLPLLAPVEDDIDSAIRDYVFQNFVRQGVRLQDGESLYEGLENLFTSAATVEDEMKRKGWTNRAEFEEFEKRRLSIQGRDHLIRGAKEVEAGKLRDTRGLALAMEVLKPGFFIKERPELARRFLTAEDIQVLADADTISCALGLIRP